MAVGSASWLLQMALGDTGTREQDRPVFVSGKVTEVYDKKRRCVYIREPVLLSNAESKGLALHSCQVFK